MRFTVFTKPFKEELPTLGKRLAAMGVDGIELPVRPGYPVTPDNALLELPKAIKLLKSEFGITVESIAADASEPVIVACGNAGVPILRLCPSVPDGESYVDAEKRHQKAFQALVPLLDRHKVAIGVQNHSGRNVPVHAMGLVRFLAPFEAKHVCAVWDAAHNALEGENLSFALDLIHGPYLRMLNLKNGYKKRETDGKWRTHWVSGQEGLASWKLVAEELKKRKWDGVVCLTAEYTAPFSAEQHLSADLAYARSLF